MPKVDHEDQLGRIGQEISRAVQSNPELLQQRPEPLSVVASIESAQALWRIGDIARWKSKHGHLSALLVRSKLLPVICEDLMLTPSLRPRIVREIRSSLLDGSIKPFVYRLRGHTDYSHTNPPGVTVYTIQDCGSSEGLWSRRDRYGESLYDL